MTHPTWTDKLSALSTAVVAGLTLMLLILAIVGWRTAKQTLDASKVASQAAASSAEAARLANEQAKFDSIEQARPYVYVEIVPGLSGLQCWDLVIKNVGRSSAKTLTLAYDKWPDHPDDVATSLRTLFDTSRTLPPTCGLRVIWRLEGNFTTGEKVVGVGRDGTITVRYTSDDPSNPDYHDVFDVMIGKSGLTPAGEQGSNGDGLHGDAETFYRLGQTLVRRVTELSR